MAAGVVDNVLKRTPMACWVILTFRVEPSVQGVERKGAGTRPAVFERRPLGRKEILQVVEMLFDRLADVAGGRLSRPGDDRAEPREGVFVEAEAGSFQSFHDSRSNRDPRSTPSEFITVPGRL